MDAFSYLSVLISIIIGLAITQILQGFRGLVIARARVRSYGPSLAWAGLLLVMSVQAWWAMFGLKFHEDWTFVQFAVVILQTILLYMLAALVLPDFDGDERVDLRTHYFEQYRWFFGLSVLLLIVSLAKDLVITGHLPERINVAFHVAFMLAAGVAAITRWEAYHRGAPWVVALALGGYIAVLFARLGSA